MRWWIAGLMVALVSGCGTSGRRDAASPAEIGARGSDARGAEAEEEEPLPTDPRIVAMAASVRIFQNEGLTCSAEALGPVDVHNTMKTSTERALDELRLRAAALGAEAVVNTEFEHGEGGDAVTHLSGMAVRCRDLLKGRAYDVIGEVKVQGPMGKEEAAFQRLRAKAIEMHASLVLNVKFEHGERSDGELPTLTGTAIRFRNP